MPSHPVYKLPTISPIYFICLLILPVMYSAHLDCFISCATNYKNSLVLGWIEKSKMNMRTWVFWQHLHGVPLSFEKCADKILHLESQEALIQRRERSPSTNVVWVRFWPWGPMWVELNGSLLWGLFLKIHETFRVPQLIPFISSHCQGSKPSTFAILLVFLTFVSMLKHQLFKTSRLKFDNWLFWVRKVVGTFERQALEAVSRKTR